MRIPQTKAEKGSQKWLQILVNDHGDFLADRIRSQAPMLQDTMITWLSPLESDDYAEYRDEFFLDILGLKDLSKELSKFWPKRGPQWDALAKGSQDQYILVEAKANIRENVSYCGAKDSRSISLIKKRLEETQGWLDSKNSIDWSRGFYQFANRLAHLYFLRELHHKEAFLVYLYFLNDETETPTSLEAWQGALYLQKKLIGIKYSQLKCFKEIFIDTKEITILG